ncbi:probable FLR1 - Putative H+ antiporter involved in multidrug resistance [Melanopsichium pennsylvanicum]|uniref:Probable FLR1 - Putative H+ antiporter involved in multidrug resistance n=2 Tax=Melanopsichium pennsylvanicum TaxID=63383 RepID=A0AAJ4XGX5_9BASI|nr:probable FLR1-Putative H antiporter involved in multidrug resistance [Melanopsichium pennsylvanicum 4]SNX82189.1 probable FLR1 - Putative H+ antiporter involved in multidrug resistance [Melanopsichium pennsylvanicum]
MSANYSNDHGNVDDLNHQPNTNSPAKHDANHHVTKYRLPWYQDTFWGLLIHRASKGKIFPYPEQRDDYVAPEKYLPGHKNKHRGGTATRTGSNDSRLGGHASPLSSASDATHVNTRENFGKGEKASTMVEAGRTPPQTPQRVQSNLDSSTSQQQGEKPVESPPQSSEDESDPYLVDWNGPDDPDNPQNWSMPRKAFVNGLLCLLTFSVYMGSAIYTPGVELFSKYFGIGVVPATLGLTLFVLGYGIGPMVGFSSISEIPAIGRSMPYLFTLFIFVILQIPTALVKNVAGFMILRFLSGLFGSPPLATGGASIGDLYSARNRPLGLGVWGLSAVCGPSLGPLIGGFAAQSFGIEGWRWTIWPLLMLSGFTLVVLVIALPETSSANILQRRAQRLRTATGNPHLRTKGELFSETLTGKELARMTFIRPFVLSFREPIVLALNLHIGLVYGILYLWFEAFPLVFVQAYGFNEGELGLAFMGIFVGAVLTYGGFVLWHRYSYVPVFDRQDGKVAPEKWLEPGIVGAWAIPICMFGFGWTANASIHWIAPIILSSFFSVGTFLLFQSGLSYLGDCYPDYIASVYAGNDFFRASIGATLPLVARAMFNNLQSNGPKAFPVAWGCVLIGCISVLMGPIPFLLYKFGPKLRAMSKYAVDPSAGGTAGNGEKQ